MRHTSIAGFIYLIVGLVVAYNHGYLVGLTTINNLLSGLMAILIWPLVLLNVNLHLVF